MYGAELVVLKGWAKNEVRVLRRAALVVQRALDTKKVDRLLPLHLESIVSWRSTPSVVMLLRQNNSPLPRAI